jgi:methionyl aminopeptidase
VFKKGDIVSVDVGIYYKGFHTDTSFSVSVKDDKNKKFLSVGEEALGKAIKKAKPGNKVYDISETIEKVLKKAGYVPVKALVGHGIGKDLHEEPQIPCFVNGKREDYPNIGEGAVLAIEVMYTKKDGKVRVASDGWTIETRDGKISALFEETVAVTKKGPIIITR